MLPDSKIASDITVSVPVDIARFRFSAYADEDEYPDVQGSFTSRIERAVEVVESMTRLSLKRATYTCEWERLPEAPRSERDNPLTFPGLHGEVTAFEALDGEGNATAMDTDLWRALPASEIGSIRIVPTAATGRWPMQQMDGPVRYRVTGTAGCDPSGRRCLPGPFFEGTALIFRYLWATEPESMTAAKVLLSKWIVAGSSV